MTDDRTSGERICFSFDQQCVERADVTRPRDDAPAAASKTTTAGQDATNAAAGNSMIVASEPS